MLSTHLYSCDVCGCAGSSSFFGIIPQFQKNLIGVRYQFQQFSHPNTALNMNGESRVLNDRFQSTEVWGRFYLGKRWQMLVFVPYRFNTREETEQISTINGMGDVSTHFNYKLIDQSDSIGKKRKHLLLAGAGIKWPTGPYQQRNPQLTQWPLPFQTGNGAYAFNLHTFYVFRFNKWAFNNQLIATQTSSNELSYRMGNSLTYLATLSYWKDVKQSRFLPQLGLFAEWSDQDYSYRKPVDHTGAKAVSLHAGFEWFRKSIYANAMAQWNLYQDKSQSQPLNRGRINLSLGYMF